MNSSYSRMGSTNANTVPDVLLLLLPVILIISLMVGLCCTIWCYVVRTTRRIEAELQLGTGSNCAVKCDGMKKMKYKKNWLKKASLKSDVCAICLEDFCNRVEINLCTCGHAYHHKCIMRWMEIKNTCPICQRCVREKQIREERSPLLGVATFI